MRLNVEKIETYFNTHPFKLPMTIECYSNIQAIYFIINDSINSEIKISDYTVRVYCWPFAPIQIFISVSTKSLIVQAINDAITSLNDIAKQHIGDILTQESEGAYVRFNYTRASEILMRVRGVLLLLKTIKDVIENDRADY